MQLVLIAAMIVMFYFFSIRPQAKRQRAHQDMLAGLTTDDVVVTRGGMIGKVADVTSHVLVLEVQDHVRIQVPRAYVEGKWTAPVAA
jgi:preprotein translocase subunit YajC